MSVSQSDRSAVDAYFKAMQLSPDRRPDAMAALFTDDGEYVEPFFGQPRTHKGKAAIRRFFEESAQHEQPGMRVTVNRVDVDGDRLRSEWTCTFPQVPQPMRGYDLYTIRGGKIARLEIHVIEGMPPAPPSGRSA